MRDMASFDPSYTTTPQEYAGWGAGLFVEPALKVTFADGNRDLVLHYQSHTATADGFEVVLRGHPAGDRRHPALRDRPGERNPGPVRHRGEPRGRARDPGARGVGGLGAAAGPLHAELPDRPLGGGVDADPGGPEPGRARAREPARLHRPPGEPVVRHPGRRARRGARGGVVRGAGVERLVAHHGGAGPAGRGARDRRLQPVRLRLRAAPGRGAGDAGVLRRVLGPRARRGVAADAPLPAGAHPAPAGGERAEAAAGDLQLLGGHATST